MASENLDELASTINRYSGLGWDKNKLEQITAQHEQTKEKINAIFYTLLEEGAELEPSFRYLLKALASGAGLLDEYCMEGDPDEELWRMVSALFGALEAAPDTRAAAAGMIERFEKELSRRLGYGDDVSAIRMAKSFLLE